MRALLQKISLNSIGLMALLLIFNACSPSRRVPSGQYLLDRNIIKVKDGKVPVSEIEPILKQSPNKRLFGTIRFHLWTYNISSGGKDNKLKEKVRTIVGEPPVILDSSLADLSARQIQLYLINSGYLNADVSKEIQKRKIFKKRAVIVYNLLPHERYMIADIKSLIADSLMKNIIDSTNSFALIRKGQPFDAKLLDDERERITRVLRESGYYYFLPDFIYYMADTSLGDKRVGLELIIDDQTPSSVAIPWNRRCRIKNIYVHLDQVADREELKPDTTVYYDMIGDAFTRIYFITKGKEYFKSTVARCVFMRQGELYNIGDAEQTYSRISDLKNFKYINIRFTRIDTISDENAEVTLKCDIYLTPMLRQDYAIETEGTNTAGDPGLAASFVYRNRNLMKGAEILNLRLYGALEVQRIVDVSQSESVIKGLPFNTIESGVDFTLEVPKFLVPFKATAFPKYFKPKSTVKTGLSYQKRPDYTRYVALVNYGYQWRQTDNLSHMLTPFELSSIKIYPDSMFQLRIEALKDPKLRMQYRDHLITSANYSIIYNTQQINRRQNFTYAHFNMELAGNLLWAMNTILGSERQYDNSFTLFNIRYAQYMRFAFDFREYKYPTSETTIAYRVSMGIGIPYGNLDVLPFEKSYYAGGANGIRAWPLRTLGPGSYRDTSGLQIDRTGDLDLESALEYRFKVYKFLEGATFVDAGNIWLTWPSQEYPGGDFQFSRFYKEIAIGAGIGARLDFSFFILRLDAAVPLKDPSMPEGQRWVLNNTQLKDIRWNFAIGYPF